MKERLQNYYKNYIIDYQILDKDRIKIISTSGRYRIVKNNRKNINKINQVIVKSKVEIARFIDEYTAEFNSRLLPFITSAFIILLSGCVSISTFFIGSYILFVGAILGFAASVIATTVLGFDYVVRLSEVRHLKKLTGYKKEYEVELPKLKVNMFTK